VRILLIDRLVRRVLGCLWWGAARTARRFVGSEVKRRKPLSLSADRHGPSPIFSTVLARVARDARRSTPEACSTQAPVDRVPRQTRPLLLGGTGVPPVDFGVSPKSAPRLALAFAAALGATVNSSIAQDQARTVAPGLICKASDGEREVTFVAPTPNFTLDARQSLHPQLKPAFTAHWEGSLKIMRGGRYAIYLLTENGVGAQKVLDLKPGLLPLSFGYDRPAGPARQQLQWESEFFRREPIPSTVLFHGEPAAGTAKTARLERGRQLLEELNCTACHPSDATFLHGRQAPDLSGAGSRLKADWIYHWLGNPRHFRSSAVMPEALESDQDRADVAAYLGSLRETPIMESPAVEGDAGVRSQKGKEGFARLGCAVCHGPEGVSLAGLGSKLDAGALARYLEHPLQADPSGRMPDFYLTNSQAQDLALYLMQSRNPEFEQTAPAGDARRGRQLVAACGCLNCHTLTVASEKMQSSLAAPRLGSLHAGRGCVAESPGGAAPRFALTPEDRASLDGWLQSPDASQAPTQDFQRLVGEFRCEACHAIRGPATLTLPPNQMPPSLTDAGNKLRRGWIQEVLFEGKRARPWLAMPMPNFGEDNIGALVDGFAAQAGAELGEGARVETVRIDLSEEGVHLMGTDEKGLGPDEGGLGCILCHDYRGEAAQGEMRAPDLTQIEDRVRTDWIARWLFDPARTTPGTAMPDFFSAKPARTA
jgi:mono/diheme cytochrome c family protein